MAFFVDEVASLQPVIAAACVCTSVNVCARACARVCRQHSARLALVEDAWHVPGGDRVPQTATQVSSQRPGPPRSERSLLARKPVLPRSWRQLSGAC